jgi:acetylornithine/LysW-gamma-L-lysine aminotransferase
MKPDIHQSIQRHFCANTYVDRGLTLIRGDGVYLYDSEGTEYLDLMSNYGVNILGYNNPQITKALKDQLDKLTTLHGSFNNDARAVAAKVLVKRCGGNLRQVYFSNSGSEAIEAALKFVVLATQKKKFIVATHGYHGKTLGALSATQGDKYKEAFMPLLWDFKTVEFGDSKALEIFLDSDIAAVILEPVQGEAGIYPPPKDYIKKVRQLCDKYGVLLILDEIQTGCGRTGMFLATQEQGINYDLVCLGKGLAGGIPVGATVISEQIVKNITKHIHTATFGGNPLACAGIVATLDWLDEALLQNVRETGKYFMDQLSQLNSDQIIAVRGVGLMIGLEVKNNRDQMLKDLQAHHILAIPAGNNVIRFLPPLLIQKQHVDQLVKVLKVILKEK